MAEINIELEALKEKLEDLKLEVKDLNTRTTKIEMSREKTEYQYEQIMKAIEDLTKTTIPNLAAQVDELKNKPIKRYDTFVTSLITVINGAIIGVLTAIFKTK